MGETSLTKIAKVAAVPFKNVASKLESSKFLQSNVTCELASPKFPQSKCVVVCWLD